MRSDTGLKVTFLFSVVIIPTPRIDFAPLPQLYKQTIFPSDEVNSYKPVSLIRVSCTIIAARREFIEIVRNVHLLYFIVEPLAVKRRESLEFWSHFVNIRLELC